MVWLVEIPTCSQTRAFELQLVVDHLEACFVTSNELRSSYVQCTLAYFVWIFCPFYISCFAFFLWKFQLISLNSRYGRPWLTTYHCIFDSDDDDNDRLPSNYRRFLFLSGFLFCIRFFFFCFIIFYPHFGVLESFVLIHCACFNPARL